MGHNYNSSFTFHTKIQIDNCAIIVFLQLLTRAKYINSLISNHITKKKKKKLHRPEKEKNYKNPIFLHAAD